MRYLSLVLLALLAACANPTGPSSSPTPQSAVYASKLSYEAALVVAVAYTGLPRCNSNAIPMAFQCSDPAAIDAIRKANIAARVTLDAAENTVRTAPGTDAATTAVLAAANATKAFQQIVTLYSPPKGP